MARLSPSILSADYANLLHDVKVVEEAGVDLLHIDVMDGHFVPNITIGAGVMKSLLGRTEAAFDVHLMIENPDKYLEDFITENTEYLTVHIEACPHIHRTIGHIKEAGAKMGSPVKAGVVINPGTPVCAIKEVLSMVDMVLVMSVNPGFGGQKYIPETLDKIKELDAIRAEKGYGYVIEIDGGVGLDNAKEICDAGCDILVSGSKVFGAEDVPQRVKDFHAIIK